MKTVRGGVARIVGAVLLAATCGIVAAQNLPATGERAGSNVVEGSVSMGSTLQEVMAFMREMAGQAPDNNGAPAAGNTDRPATGEAQGTPVPGSTGVEVSGARQGVNNVGEVLSTRDYPIHPEGPAVRRAPAAQVCERCAQI